MARHSNLSAKGWIPAQRDALILWIGDPNSIPAGFALCDGELHNGYQTKNLDGLSLRTPAVDDTSYGITNNASGVGNDVLNANTFVFSSTSDHAHEGITRVELVEGDGDHTHSINSLTAYGFKLIKYNLSSRRRYATNGSNVIYTADTNSETNQTDYNNGKPLVGNFEDKPEGHNHVVDVGPNTDYLEEIAEVNSGHGHGVEGGDAQTRPAQFAAKWIVWVGYS